MLSPRNDGKAVQSILLLD